MTQEKIADQDTGLIAPKHPRGHLAPAQVALVDDVIVQERRGMHEFDRGGEFDMALPGIVAKAGGRQEKCEDRTHPLAP